jgi:hypothetical protein
MQVWGLLLSILASAGAFTTRGFVRSSTSALFQAPGGDPMDAIRAKMAQDPNYDPMKDPQAMQMLESIIPAEMREIPNSIERLKVAFQDATTGPDSKTLAELSVELTSSNVKELISSPNSQWFRGGMADSDTTDKAKLDELYSKLQAENPDVPTN